MSASGKLRVQVDQHRPLLRRHGLQVVVVARQVSLRRRPSGHRAAAAAASRPCIGMLRAAVASRTMSSIAATVASIAGVDLGRADDRVQIVGPFHEDARVRVTVSEMLRASRERSSARLPAGEAGIEDGHGLRRVPRASSVCSLNGYDWASPASSARNENGGEIVPAVMLSPNARIRVIRRLAGVEGGGVGGGSGSAGGGVYHPRPGRVGEPPQPSVRPAVTRAAPTPIRNCRRNIRDLSE